MGETHNVRLEPVGIDFEVDEDETVLNAAFRQGLALMHGCKEGQCSACKSFLLDGEVDLERYSTFALPDFEEAEGWTLLCRAHALTDLEVELVNYDEEMLRSGLPVTEMRARVDAVEPLTHDIRRLVLTLTEPEELEFHPGQYVDISIPGAEGGHRSFSMANLPSDKGRLEFMIKLYPDGRFSGLLADGEIAEGQELDIKGPYGMFTLRDQSPRRLLFIGGGRGNGADPVPAALDGRAEDRARRRLLLRRPQGGRPVPPRRARGAGGELPSFQLRARAVRRRVGRRGGNDHRRGRALRGGPHDVDAYICGPPPMVEAAQALLMAKGVPESRIYFDKFTTTESEETSST